MRSEVAVGFSWRGCSGFGMGMGGFGMMNPMMGGFGMQMF
jgi:hypothetical protein